MDFDLPFFLNCLSFIPLPSISTLLCVLALSFSMQQAEEKANEKGNELKGNTGSTNKAQKSKTDKKRVGSKEQEDFKPVTGSV